ncbi:MAG TPA: PAS domain-containing protein [Spirochaetia bacterium]|nr:PAS domain-containing protein [Spirochaetia bacterium]
MSEAVVRAMFETVPMEITIIDAKDEVVGWNKHDTRIFRRPLGSMGLNFRDCHPEESLPRVVRIVEEMRNGTRDTARFWLDLALQPGTPKHKILIEFFALRDERGSYLGCMECTQDIEEIRGLEGQKRLLDE